MKTSRAPDNAGANEQGLGFDEQYFDPWVRYGRFSQYWWARRYYAGLVKRFQRAGRVLEIGCGLGDLLSRLEKRFETYGIDISDFAIERARETARRSQLQVLPAEGIDTFGPAFFDAIIGIHVVEHLEDPEAVLRKCANISKPGAFLLLATPNLGAPFVERKGAEWYGHKDPTHINMKYPKEWRRLVENAGYKIEKMFGDGLWDVPYLPVIPAKLQLPFFALPAALQVLVVGTFIPTRLGESAIILARRVADRTLPSGASQPSEDSASSTP